MVRTLFAAALFLPITTSAATFRTGSASLVLDLPLTEDTYATAEWITLPEDTTLSGDLFSVAKTIDVKGTASEDIVAAAMTLTIAGKVRDDAHIAGQTVTITGTVQDDVFVAGETVTIGEDAVIGGDLVLLAKNASILGTVKGNVFSHGTNISVSGDVGGALTVKAKQISLNGSVAKESSIQAKSISVGPSALLKGDVTYGGTTDAVDFGSAAKGSVTRQASTPVPMIRADDLRTRMRDALPATSLLSAGLILLLLMTMTKRFFVASAKAAKARPLATFFLGLLFFVCTPIVGTLLLVTIIGWPLAVYAFIIFFLAILFAKVFAALTFAEWIQMKHGMQTKKWMTFLTALVVFAVLKLLPLIPAVGWILQWILICISTGAIIMTKRDIWKKYA